MSNAMQEQEQWITIAEAAERSPVTVAKSTIRRWIEEGKYGIIAGRFGGRVVIRADTLPGIVEDPTL